MTKTRSRNRQIEADEGKRGMEDEEKSSSSEEEEDVAEDDGSEEDSDSSPEDVSFKQSKMEVMESVSAALKQVEESKQKLKEKRRRHHELLSDQKRKKLERLQSKKLPADFLKEVSQTSIPTSPSPAKVKDDTQMHQHFDDEDDDGRKGSGEDESTPIADRFYVVSAPKAGKRPHPKPDKALEFLQQSLYGKGVKRVSVSNIIDHNAKKEGLPGRHFTDAKAKRNRRKHRSRQIPAS